MSDIRTTVKENLIRLRHEHKLTQLELSQRINYSDKAISRWENGDVTPDVETLAALAELYGVPITVFFLPAGAQLSAEEQRALKKAKKEEEKEEKRKRREEERMRKEAARQDAPKSPAGSRRTAFLVFGICLVWAAVLSLFFLLASTVDGAWRIFLWGAPATVLLLLLYFRSSRHSAVRTVFASLLLWSFLACLYVQIARWSLFPILFAGIPLEALIILLPFFRKAKEETK